MTWELIGDSDLSNVDYSDVKFTHIYTCVCTYIIWYICTYFGLLEKVQGEISSSSFFFSFFLGITRKKRCLIWYNILIFFVLKYWKIDVSEYIYKNWNWLILMIVFLYRMSGTANGEPTAAQSREKARGTSRSRSFLSRLTSPQGP